MTQELLKKINIDKLLYLKLIIFLIFIVYLICVYDNHFSISQILCNRKNNYFIVFVTFLLGICSFIYELKKNDKYSMCIMFTYLISTFFVILFTPDHIEHYIFASLVTICVFSYMIYTCIINNCNNIMKFIFLLQFVVIGLYIKNVINFYWVEILFLIIFALFIALNHP
jgi:hypothetical protein